MTVKFNRKIFKAIFAAAIVFLAGYVFVSVVEVFLNALLNRNSLHYDKETKEIILWRFEIISWTVISIDTLFALIFVLITKKKVKIN